MKIADFRSDTVTKPSPEMWERLHGMDNTHIGDDVARDDPTVIELEEIAAKLVGKEAALLVTSGTQGNLISLLAQTTPGDEILVEERSHIYKWEVGGAARLGGLMVKTFSSNKGIFSPNSLQDLIRPRDDIHQPFTSLISVENTHNFHGGIILPVELFKETKKFAQANHLKFHVDGARIFNASVAKNIPVTEYTQHVDSIQFCISKGLSCPIGSIIAGTSEFIESARKWRKMLGGGWRQAGIIASFGIEALKSSWIDRLAEDHKMAKYIAKEINATNSGLYAQFPETNIVMVEIPKTISMELFLNKLHDVGVLAYSMGDRIRLVTHFGLTQENAEYCIKKMYEISQMLDSK